MLARSTREADTVTGVAGLRFTDKHSALNLESLQPYSPVIKSRSLTFSTAAFRVAPRHIAVSYQAAAVNPLSLRTSDDATARVASRSCHETSRFVRERSLDNTGIVCDRFDSLMAHASI